MQGDELIYHDAVAMMCGLPYCMMPSAGASTPTLAAMSRQKNRPHVSVGGARYPKNSKMLIDRTKYRSKMLINRTK